MSPRFEDRRSPFRPEFYKGWRKSIGWRESLSTSASRAEVSSDCSISVWVSSTKTLMAGAANLRILTHSDRASLLKIRSPALRDSATAARIMLRLALSFSTNRRMDPEEWQFDQTELGRPYIVKNVENLDFSVSHGEGIAMAAVGRNVRIGIDVESVEQPLEKSLLDSFCHRSEAKNIQLLPPDRHHRNFIEVWTEKEAYTKMVGLGHALEFGSFDLGSAQSLNANRPAAVIEGFYVPLDRNLYYAALAVERTSSTRKFHLELVTAALSNERSQSSSDSQPCVT